MIASYGKMSEMPKRKKKRFSAVQTVKAMARERIGAIFHCNCRVADHEIPTRGSARAGTGGDVGNSANTGWGNYAVVQCDQVRNIRFPGDLVGDVFSFWRVDVRSQSRKDNLRTGRRSYEGRTSGSNSDAHELPIMRTTGCKEGHRANRC